MRPRLWAGCVHKGHAFNELADVLARAQRLPDSLIPAGVLQLTEWIQDGSIEWLRILYATARSPTVWPQLQGDCIVDRDRQDMPFPLPSVRFLSRSEASSATAPTQSEQFTLYMRLLSINVQTLSEHHADGVQGRVPYVREQLVHQQVLLAGLQETRAKETETIVSSSHFRFLSAADQRGCLGVELWVARTVPFAYRHGKPLYFEAQDFRVLAWSPRYLVMRCQRSDLKLLIVVCHAPTASDPHRASWWKGFADRLLGIVKGDQVVILGDLNVRFVQQSEPHVGDLCWESGEAIPTHLLRLLQVLRLWVPSTYTACHHGLSHTWASPGHGSLSRIDYIVVPLEWPVQPASSVVLHEVDFGQAGVDHFAVQLDIEVKVWGNTGTAPKKPRIDARQLKDPRSSQIVRDICDTAPVVPWNVDVHTHCDQLTRHLFSGLAAAFPVHRAVCRRVFFTETTWNFRQQRTALRRFIHKGLVWIFRFEVRWALDLWRNGGCFLLRGLQLVAATIWRVKRISDAVADLRKLKPLLRGSINKDRAIYLHEVAVAATRAPGKNIFERLRPLLGPPKRKQRTRQSLPAIELEDGTVAPDRASAEARWIRHFAAIEAGHPAEPLDIVAQCLRRQQAHLSEECEINLSDVPGRVMFEAGLRAAASDRAAGLDGIPPELLHFHAPEISNIMFGLFLKMSFRQAEPLHWKGGELFSIWKRKGSVLQCDNYRAILVSSCLGKAAHWTFRKKCSPLLDTISTPLQVGGRAGCPVQLAIQAARLFQEMSRQRGASCALIFVDLKEAFHRVARPLVHGGEVGEKHLRGVISSLGLKDSVLPDLQAYVQSKSLIREAGASEWLTGMMKEFSRDTWFALGREQGTALVTSGTRPGDNLADLIFSFLFSRILKELRDSFQREDISLCLPWCDRWLCAGPDEVSLETADQEARPIDVTWMDDLALLVSAQDPSLLLQRATDVATATITECIKATLLPNLARGKTEAVVCLRGRGAKKLAAEVFRGTDPSLQLASPVWPEARIRLVPTYKHVGGMISAGGGHGLELKSRIGAAWSSFRAHKRKVFASPIVSPQDKSVLFMSVVEGTLYYGVGVWPGITEADVERTQTALVGMARLMLRPMYTFEQACHLSPAFVIAFARILPAEAAFHLERLRHFRVIITQASEELWALLHAEKTWLHDVCRSLQWMQQQLQAAGCAQHQVHEWPRAVEAVRQPPGFWRRLVKRARTSALLLARWQGEKQLFYGQLLRQFKKAGVQVSDALTERGQGGEVCAVCKQFFPDLRRWAHHAFKRHGRVREERKLVDGKQCPHCLHHFACTERVCNHLRHNAACRRALIARGHQVDIVPGVGSKKYDDGTGTQLPAVQAEGPLLPGSTTDGLDEQHRPDPDVLLRLEECFCCSEDSCSSPEHLQQLYRQAFSVSCLQVSRLQATIRAWQVILQEELDSSEEHSLQWSSWHLSQVRYLQCVDWPAWLLPEEVERRAPLMVYRDAETLLPWIQTPSPCFPPASEVVGFGVCCSERDVGLGRHVSHEACWTDPGKLTDVLAGEAHVGSLRVLSCLGLLVTLQPPHPLKGYRQLEPQLVRLRLYSDLLRGAVHLWSQGQPAVVLCPDLACACLPALKATAPYSLRTGTVWAFGNVRCEEVLSCFTSVN